MTQRIRIRALLVAFALLFGASTALADSFIIFNNSNNPSNSVCCGYTVGASHLYASPFTPVGRSFDLDSVGLLESQSLATVDSLFLSSMTPGGSPGTVLESWQNIPLTSSIVLEKAAPVAHPFLQRGQQYWFGVMTTKPLDAATWWINPASVGGTECSDIDGGSCSCSNGAVGAFEISRDARAGAGELLLLLGTGVLALGGLLIRKLTR